MSEIPVWICTERHNLSLSYLTYTFRSSFFHYSMEYFATQKTFQPDMKHYKMRSSYRILRQVSYRWKRDWFNLNKSYNLFEWSSLHPSQTSGIRVTSLNVGGEGGRGEWRERRRDILQKARWEDKGEVKKSSSDETTSQELVEVTTDRLDEESRGVGVDEVKRNNNYFQRLGWEWEVWISSEENECIMRDQW